METVRADPLREATAGSGAPVDVTIENVERLFGETPALHDVSLTIAAGELVALLGPSGSGKTTLLRIIAGLEFPTAGRILFGGEDALKLSRAASATSASCSSTTRCSGT